MSRKNRLWLGTAMALTTTVISAQEAVQPAEGATASIVDSGSVTSDAAYPATIAVQVQDGAELSETPQRTSQYAGGIDEVIVTAQKRAESIQSVPIAITAFSGDELTNAGVSNISDLGTKTAGLSYDGAVNYAIIYIRGVGTDAFIPSADLSVATYIDGIYFPFSFGLARTLGDVERVEILKGPQGTLFGRNATGGAISIVTKDPSSDAWRGSLSSVVGNYNQVDNRVSISGPITSTLSMSAGALYNRRDDYYNVAAPSTVGSIQPYRDLGGNVKIQWTPSEYFDARLGGFYLEAKGIGSGLLVSLDPSPAGVAAGVTKAPDYQTNSNIDSFAITTAKVAMLTLGVHPGPLDIKSITGYQESAENINVDFDGSSANLVGFGNPDKDTVLQQGHVFTQELQFLSNDESPWADHFNWIAGLYYLKSSFGYVPVHFQAANLQQGLSGLGDGTFPVGSGLNTLIGGLTDAFGPLVDPLTNTDLLVFGSLDTESGAAFFQTTIKPTDWSDVILGGRVQKERRKVHDSSLEARATVLGQESVVPILSFADDTLSATNFSPKVTIDVKPFEDVLLYTSYQRAFKSASFNVVNLTAPPSQIRSETVTTIEAGAKSQFFDRHVQLNGAVYRNRIDNLQSQFISLLSGGIIQFQSAKQATIKGIDLDLLWLIAPGLRLDAGVTHLESKYDSFSDALGYSEDLGVFNGNNQYTGNQIVRNPRYTATAGLEYSLELSEGTLTFAGAWYYNSGFYYDPANVLKQNPYSRYSGHASYLYQPWDLQVSLFGENITNEKYFIYKFQDDFGVVGKLASPRTYGIRLNWNF